LAEKLFRAATADVATFVFFSKSANAVHHFLSLGSINASAERALNKLMRIGKNRLQSSLCDEMLASPLVLASERDTLQYMKTDVIIDKLANDVPSLKSHLLCLSL